MGPRHCPSVGVAACNPPRASSPSCRRGADPAAAPGPPWTPSTWSISGGLLSMSGGAAQGTERCHPPPGLAEQGRRQQGWVAAAVPTRAQTPAPQQPPRPHTSRARMPTLPRDPEDGSVGRGRQEQAGTGRVAPLTVALSVALSQGVGSSLMVRPGRSASWGGGRQTGGVPGPGRGRRRRVLPGPGPCPAPRCGAAGRDREGGTGMERWREGWREGPG